MTWQNSLVKTFPVRKFLQQHNTIYCLGINECYLSSQPNKYFFDRVNPFNLAGMGEWDVLMMTSPKQN
jgi:hypothetical protein